MMHSPWFRTRDKGRFCYFLHEGRSGVGGGSLEVVEDDRGTSNDVGITNQGGVLLRGGGDVRGTLGLGQVDLSVLDGVGSDVKTLVEGNVLTIGSTGDGTSGSIIGQCRESLEGKGGVAGGA